MFSHKKIFTPGPTQVHPDVLNVVVSNTPYHRSSDFGYFHQELLDKLRKIFMTDSHICVLTCSGTGAMEAAVVNFCSRNDKILFVNQGRFGARWGQICKAWGLDSFEISIPYGESVLPEDFDRNILEKSDVIFLTHVETSTATSTDIKLISQYIKKNSNAIVITDAVTSVGAVEFRMDEWGIDVAVSASQKGMMTPPGLAIIAFNDKAIGKLRSSDLPRFYFDLNKEIRSISNNLTSWTPSVNLFYGLDKAADIILEYGIEKWWNKTVSSAGLFRDFCLSNNLELFSRKPADSLTAFSLPDGMSSTLLVKALREKHGIQIADGQADLKGKIARVSHMGNIFPDDTLELVDIIYHELKILSESVLK